MRSGDPSGAGERAREGAAVRECRLGLTRGEVTAQVGEHRLDIFDHWMRGQTAAICDGRRYDRDLGEYVADCANPHGLVVYAHDVRQFLAGGGPLD